MRRNFIKALALTPFWAGMVKAQSLSTSAAPYKEVNIPSDRKVVRLFLSFDCPYSMESFEPLYEWGKSLPKSIRFEIDQVASSQENISYAVLWEAVKKVGTPKEQFQFAQQFFNYVKEQKVAPTNPQFYEKLFKENKIPNLALAVRAISKKDLLEKMRRDAKYKLSATPSLGIGGRYSASPENTNGDYAMFMELANGLVSQILG